jgi:heme oxygenase
MSSSTRLSFRRIRTFSSGGSIFKQSSANKSGLSFALDSTMRSGAHDMGVFGTGTLCALTSKRELLTFLRAHHAFYAAMEQHLDAAQTRSGDVWRLFANDLRRAPALQKDILSLGGSMQPAYSSEGTRAYESRLLYAATEEAQPSAPPLLLGHLYTRYLADLFGGSMLGAPARFALGLPNTPHFYQHSDAVSCDRRAYIERLYEALNVAGSGLNDASIKAVVDEATLAFRLNGSVYRESSFGGNVVVMHIGAVIGGARVAVGFAAARLQGEKGDIFGRA